MIMSNNLENGLSIHIKGIVQGVGFRPFVYNLATRYGLTGWVRNTSAGVDIDVDGPFEMLQNFTESLRLETPPLAVIDEMSIVNRKANHYTSFWIEHSIPIPNAFQPISPDVATCPDCLQELSNPVDRRFRYPFINCTNCGPRFTIIEDVPYDRPNTTMAGFTMCPACSREYNDPADRRFHAQPIACPDCGPKVWLESQDPQLPEEWDAILKTQFLLSSGKILAIKGLGGFHLACDATNPSSVEELRRRKLRVDKPFALMLPDLAAIRLNCELDEFDEQLLASPSRPIVLLDRTPGSLISTKVAPGQNKLGVMLPYTPLHHLLFSPPPGNASLPPLKALVMTSGNLSEEPIAFTNEEARHRLASLADGFLMYNRPIRTRCDDSVLRQDRTNKKVFFVRRSRGFTPTPIHFPWKLPPLLATGSDLKNTFCLCKEDYAFLSHHIGDMENYETLLSFEDGINHFQKIFHINPEVIACDSHPNYFSSRFAREFAQSHHLPIFEIQHHHAHITACMAEHNFPDEPVIGIAFDGTGYGDDGAIWGGEFLLATYREYRRLYHLKYMPLPGGEISIKNPVRIAFAYLWQAGIEWYPELPFYDALCAQDRMILQSQLEHQINTPITSSMGRLFDAVSAILGIRSTVNYEAQAAIEMEAVADPDEIKSYPMSFIQTGSEGEYPIQVDPSPLLKAICSDIGENIPVSTISAKFHNSVADMILNICMAIRNQHKINVVALSGGVWQNHFLLRKVSLLLENARFRVLVPHKLPTNDGGISLGQAVTAFHLIR